MRIAVCQPHYVPWIGYLEMVDRVDVFWCLDDVDFVKREWKNRNRIRKEREAAEAKWLTVPVEHACQRQTALCDARIAREPDWRAAHLASLQQVYARAPFGGLALELLRAGLAEPHERLADLNVALLRRTCALLGIATPIRRTSELGVAGRKTERLLAVCRAAGATAYLANNASAAYLEAGRFADAGIELAYQDYEHPRYAQRSGGRELPFLSHLSILDLVANQGPDALAVVRAGRPAFAQR